MIHRKESYRRAQQLKLLRERNQLISGDVNPNQSKAVANNQYEKQLLANTDSEFEQQFGYMNMLYGSTGLDLESQLNRDLLLMNEDQIFNPNNTENMFLSQQQRNNNINSLNENKSGSMNRNRMVSSASMSRTSKIKNLQT